MDQPPSNAVVCLACYVDYSHFLLSRRLLPLSLGTAVACHGKRRRGESQKHHVKGKSTAHHGGIRNQLEIHVTLYFTRIACVYNVQSGFNHFYWSSTQHLRAVPSELRVIKLGLTCCWRYEIIYCILCIKSLTH